MAGVFFSKTRRQLTWGCFFSLLPVSTMLWCVVGRRRGVAGGERGGDTIAVVAFLVGGGAVGPLSPPFWGGGVRIFLGWIFLPREATVPTIPIQFQPMESAGSSKHTQRAGFDDGAFLLYDSFVGGAGRGAFFGAHAAHTRTLSCAVPTHERRRHRRRRRRCHCKSPPLPPLRCPESSSPPLRPYCYPLSTAASTCMYRM